MDTLQQLFRLGYLRAAAITARTQTTVRKTGLHIQPTASVAHAAKNQCAGHRSTRLPYRLIVEAGHLAEALSSG